MSWLDRHLTDTITYQTPSGTSSFGDSTWSASQTAPARVERVSALTTTSTGEEKVSTYRLALRIALPIKARVQVPGDSTWYQVLSVTDASTLSGDALSEVLLG